MITLKDIARRVGVTPATVSYVVNGKAKAAGISDSRAREIEAVARQLGYQPNAAARSMVRKRTYCVGVLIRNAPDLPHHGPAKFDLLLGINEALESESYVMSLVRLGDVRNPRTTSRVFRERMLDGLIVMDNLPEGVDQRVESLIPRCVWLETIRWGERYCLRRDETAAGRLVVEQAAAAGYRRIVYVEPKTDETAHYSIHERRAGARDAAERLGLEWRMSHETSGRPGGGVYDGVVPGIASDTCIVGYNDEATMQSLQVALAAGFRPGADYGLACCEDTTSIAHGWGNLSRASFDRYELGRMAGRMMLEQIRDPEAACTSVRQGVSWIQGDTTRPGAAPAAAAPAS